MNPRVRAGARGCYDRSSRNMPRRYFRGRRQNMHACCLLARLILSCISLEVGSATAPKLDPLLQHCHRLHAPSPTVDASHDLIPDDLFDPHKAASLRDLQHAQTPRILDRNISGNDMQLWTGTSGDDLLQFLEVNRGLYVENPLRLRGTAAHDALVSVLRDCTAKWA